MKIDIIAQNLEQIQQEAFPESESIETVTVGSLIGKILPYIFSAAGIALLVYLVIGGLQMMVSRGDPKAMQSAQAKITNALIGFVIVFFAFTLVQIIGQLLGLEGTIFSQIFGGK